MRPGAILVLLILVSCATERRQSGVVQAPERSPEQSSSAETSVRIPPRAPAFAEPAPWPALSAFDLDRRPEGWVTDVEAVRFGLPEQFWSSHRLRWIEALGAAPAAAAFRLERLFRDSSGDEAFRAAWRLWLIDTSAGLSDAARGWLDRACELRPNAELALERAWDQAFRLHDLWGARALWAEAATAQPSNDRKYRLLRQKLFSGSQSLVPIGADDYVSSLELDRDDLWAATWDGAVVRWSLVTGDVELMRPAGDVVSPIRFLAVTGWFVYAFQDKALLRYSKVAGSWRSFPYPAGWNGLRIQGAVADGQESLWVGHLGEGLWRWERGEWKLVDAGGGGPFINALASDGQGGLWIGTKDRGLWSWSDGVWTPVPSENGAPSNITVIEPSEGVWAVGTWGEGAWLLKNGVLRRAEGNGNEYITAAAWSSGVPIWGTLDQGVFSSGRRLGPLDGVPAGVSALVAWQGRWLWGTAGQGLGWWSEDENSALSR